MAIELNYIYEPEELFECFCIAIYLGDMDFAHFLASAPFVEAYDPGVDFNLIRTAFALLREQPGLVDEVLEELEALLDKQDSAPPPLNKYGLHRATGNMLACLANKNSANFCRALQTRLNLLQEKGGNHPRDRWDLIGLGLCRLARDRGMNVDVKHPYLPLELLDAADAMSQQDDSDAS